MNKTIEIIPQINNQLEQFKSSIDVIIQQNNEYFNSIKRYSNKTFDIEINGNKFGYYFNGTVNKLNDYVKSPGCFTFSLKSNGRLKGMEKFEQKDYCDGLQIFDKTNSRLFGIGGICWIHKEYTKNTS